ncbi:NAD(P)/FAD-dependent oxidoreductase [Cumulibacter soli]|uniref:NAD(P)/FAD-dependent oxidoreductase n=1 Tax=Cumulibacter soli TaxID=2546344 RepID=UPI0010681684|nr:FAD-dependent oxidoreductase [Cumulibacter soli]
MRRFGALVIGGGIAGVSLAYELSQSMSVGVLEMEGTLGVHTTGRSAATYLESYGPPEIRTLTSASRDFFTSPPEVIGDSPLSDLGLLWVAPESSLDALNDEYGELRSSVPSIERLDAAEVRALNPHLRAEWAAGGMYEPAAMEIDVHRLHQGYRHGIAAGSEVFTDARIVTAHREDEVWVLTDTRGNRYRAPLVINAAGAWADVVAAMHGAATVGLQPLRRTLFTVPGATATGARVPMTADIDNTFYIKPEGEDFLCSPADETLDQPHDVRPQDVDIARAIEAINEATDLQVRNVRTSWAGLRSFSADRLPVIGFDPLVDGFFWFAGQGGYGIQSAPAAAHLAVSILGGEQDPTGLSSRLSPARFMR